MSRPTFVRRVASERTVCVTGAGAGVDSADCTEKSFGVESYPSKRTHPTSQVHPRRSRAIILSERKSYCSDKRHGKVAVFSKKGAFFTVSRLRSENAVLGRILSFSQILHRSAYQRRFLAKDKFYSDHLLDKNELTKFIWTDILNIYRF